MLHSPAQGGRVNWRIPIARQFIIQAQEGDGATGHFKGCDVATNKRASDSDVSAAQNPGEFVGNDIKLDQGRTAHAVDKGQHALTGFQGLR